MIRQGRREDAAGGQGGKGGARNGDRMPGEAKGCRKGIEGSMMGRLETV